MGIDFVPTGIATGVSGSIFAKEIVQAIIASGNFVLPAGLFYIYAVGANVTVQVQDSTGTWNNVTAAAVGGIFGSDGTNVRLANANAGGPQNFNYIKIG